MPSPQQPKRRDRPCDACRKRKSRCVLEDNSPVCVLCRFHNQNCTFLQEPLSRKRKVPQEPFGSDHVREADNSHSQRRLSSSSTISRNSPALHARVIRTTNGTGVEEYADLAATEHSLLKRTLGLQNNNHSQYIGATRGLEPSLLGSLSGSSLREGQVHIQLAEGTLRRMSSTEAFMLLPDPGTQNYAEELSDLDSIEAIISPHGKALVDLYFRIVFPSFPILHKEVYLEKYSRSYREFSPPLLAAVYLLALQYWTYDDSLNNLPKPDVQRLERLARKALSDTIHRPKLSTVQAGLLLLQHTDVDSAELTAQLVSVAHGLGLHLDASNWAIPSWEKGLRKRLGWALFMQSCWSSLGSGRPPLIGSSNWGLRHVTSSDFPENASHEDDQEGSSEVEKGRILFTQMIHLSEILAELLDTVFTVKASREITAAGPNGLNMVLEKVKPVQLKLKDWFSNLPDCLSMESTQILKLNAVGYLRLGYVATEITLHRRIILALTPSADPRLYQICRSVAHERFMFAIDFVQSLKPQHLSSFWYFASPQNFALIAAFGTLLLSTASNSQEVEFYRTKLREYRWTLKINSENGARYMRPAMASLDANMALLTSEKTTQSTKVAVDGGDEFSPATSNTFAFQSSSLPHDNDFSPTSQDPLGAEYYPAPRGDAGEPAMYSPATQTQGFGYGIDDRSMWTY
ncbi:fungal-specific transcription factor domain-containing protein [Amylocarpus encephaloides]|uniref:Fungal-specific transcription factor domain-containing protein n=1 Tax=Amylocarpus encephaloides TaxID=45428 RepID=A0A9P8C918_9HELO|nr:fungal-specific transcription factor domain-containing protein [Amylocarpus encephaloides]